MNAAQKIHSAMRASIMTAVFVLAALTGAAITGAAMALPLAPAQEKALKAGSAFKECDRCPEMVALPAGRFMMGSPANDASAPPSAIRTEQPQHETTIARALAVGKFEVLADEFSACIGEGGCKGWTSDTKPEGRHPMSGLSWTMAKEYVAWLAKKAGKPYRLLTEAEWEYAARAGTATAFHTGEKITVQQARFSAGTPGKAGAVLEVGQFPPNAFGLHDMAGNVEEWVEDCFNDTYKGAPIDGSAWLTGICDIRMARGGDYFGMAVHVRSAARNGFSANSRSFGFRVARTLAQ